MVKSLRKKRPILTSIFVSGVLLASSAAIACTGIILTGADGTVVRARTVEWGTFDLKPELHIVPRGYVYQAQPMPDGKPGHKWTVKYGLVGTAALGKAAYSDALNEAGLSVGTFYLPGFTTYPDYIPSKAGNSIAGVDLVAYLASQFKTIDEVRAGLKKINVAPVVEKSVGFPFPLHWIVTNKDGKSIVIEYVNKKLKIYDAPLGVITNSPTYDWHITNLRNYLNLSALSLPSKKIDGMNFAPLGAGTGMLGLPGDYTPPSRFVRAVAFSKTARKTTGGYDTVRESFRILDNFNVPIGAAEGDSVGQKLDPSVYSATQWTTASDTKNLRFYYHTMRNRRVRMIDMKKIDFGGMGKKIIVRPLDRSKEEDIQEVKP